VAQGGSGARRVLVPGAQHAHVLVDDLLSLLLEGLEQDLGRRLQLEAGEVQQRPQRGRVLHDGEELAELRGQVRHREGDEGDALRDERGIAVEAGAVEDDRAPRLHFAGMPLDAVLVEGHEDGQVVAVVVDLLLGQPQAQPGVAAAYQRLVAVVGVDVQPQPSCGAGQRVARPVQSVAGGAGDSDGDLGCHGSLLD
jgi:hypothetical protein